MKALKFAWGIGATRSGNYLPLVIANTPNGISAVDVMTNAGTWAPGSRNGDLGAQWKLATNNVKSGTNGAVMVRIRSFSNSYSPPYGTFWLPAPTGAQAVVRIVARRV